MTSNVGSQFVKASSNLGFQTDSKTKGNAGYRQKIQDALKQHFRPEFLNRIDDIMFFDPLTLKEIEKIVTRQIAEVQERLAKRGIKLMVSVPAKRQLAKEGFDPDYGARPLKRLIQKKIIDPLAERIIRGELPEGSKVKVAFRSNAYTFSK